MTEVRIVNAEALRVGPDDRLIIRVNSALPDDADESPDSIPEFVEALVGELVRVGLRDRAFIVMDTNDSVDFTVVSRAAPE